MIIEYTTLHDNVTLPKRANPSDAGLDVHFSPKDGNHVIILPGESVVLETGLKFGVPHGYMLEVKNRSSVASKRSLIVGACVIDSGYNGEVKINLHNIGNDTQKLLPGDKIAQLVMVPVVHFRASHSGDALYDDPITISGRGAGGFGSTGK
jgi:dUTP pyrophosphatase